ncbi:MAG: phage holin family protein [Thermonemataceae bacterium]|nr:phage holin family protein [Thermonemataceae bacterium]
MEHFIKLLRKYLSLHLDIFKIELQEKVKTQLSNALLLLLWLGLAFISLLFFSFAFAFYLNEVLESKFIGFILVALVFAILFAVAFSPNSRKKIKNYFDKYLSS